MTTRVWFHVAMALSVAADDLAAAHERLAELIDVWDPDSYEVHGWTIVPEEEFNAE